VGTTHGRTIVTATAVTTTTTTPTCETAVREAQTTEQ
jgi:hypothetical protein